MIWVIVIYVIVVVIANLISFIVNCGHILILICMIVIDLSDYEFFHFDFVIGTSGIMICRISLCMKVIYLIIIVIYIIHISMILVMC
jgi:hypothetical protein